jgi:hypothetical protein
LKTQVMRGAGVCGYTTEGEGFVAAAAAVCIQVARAGVPP